MSEQTLTRTTTAHRLHGASTRSTARLLSAGIAAGPVFMATYGLQALTRDGFEPGKHPLSLLALGEHGWIQIANFISVGSMLIAFGVGVGSVLPHGRGSTWGPRLIKAMGLGLVAAGVFVTDAGAGFPVGATVGRPEMSWHGALHETGFAVTMLAWTAACLVLRSHFANLGDRGWKWGCVGAVVAVAVLSAWPQMDSFVLRTALAIAVQLGFVAALAARLKRVRAASENA